ncbi:hypothetical protein ECANGB1_537 [Enterospora canceri]|uniref:Man1/Src1 C-terminal domain-containing protein n=1 Tax=Enterospora canceri TaxID=1081671 RepID=A0A1Y1S7U8_9MICR|nr:hypothetical protein ECANGB1_537 [Enterospora canceri]
MTNEFDLNKVLQKDFEYTKCTKPQLRDIMSRLDIEGIPSLYVKKSELLEYYDKHVYRKMNELRRRMNFSQENTFQMSPKRKKEEPATTVKKATVKVAIKESKPRDRVSQELKTRTTEDLKAKARSLSVSRDKTHDSSIGEKLSKNKRGRRIQRTIMFIKRIILLALVMLMIWLKFFIPYCTSSLRWCVPLPKYAHLVDGKLFCDKGYRKVTSFIDYCTYDTRIEYNNRQKAKNIIRTLENIKGEYLYGMRKSPRIDVRELAADAVVWEMLKKSDLLDFNGTQVESLNARIGMKLYLKYHIMKGLKGLVAIVGTVLFIRILYSGRRKASENKAKAEKIASQVLTSLNKQAMIAIKTQCISDTVYSTQLQEVFEIADDVWVYVEDILKNNSNVEAMVDESGELKFRWVGLLFFRSKSNESLLNK